MANTNAPFGFRYVGSRGGGAPTFEIEHRKIASGNTTAIYKGDPVVSLTTGYITRATAGTTQIAGIFIGCTYNSSSQAGKLIESPHWPGSDALGDVDAKIIADPNATFVAQTSNGTIDLSGVNANINFALGTGNATTGLSGASADVGTIGTTATLPFRVVGLITEPPGAAGTESGAYQHVLLRLNFVDTRSTTGI